MIALFLAWLAYADDDVNEQRQQAAESSFDAVMNMNAVEAAPAARPRMTKGEHGAGAITTLPIGAPASTAGGTVEVPLPRYEGVLDRIEADDERASRSYTTLVVLGASTYSGRQTAGGLSLHLQIQATLRGEGHWKTVPLVGEEVAIVSARLGSTPLPFTSQSGYQVWVTDAVGEVTLDLDLFVPARGPRGSLEFDFLVPRTPVTRFDCSFPTEGLEPRLSRAVRAEVTSGGGNTALTAWLEPTSRIRLMGFKDLGEEQGAAKIYAESLHLLSMDESTADLFTVVRYNILQAGNRVFDVLIPPGLTVVSADGEGAFRYTLGEATAEGTVLHGETAFPIRNSYEISLRLSRSLEGGSGAAFDLVPPRAMGVEREVGWLAVEVIGNLKLEEVERVEALAVDVAQLPAEMVESAVSPVLKGYRFHSSGAHVRLSATRLAEREPAAGSIDRVEATTVVAAEGRAFTDLQITLRNRLRHSLRLRLPEGVEVRSSLLDGEPVKPSKADDGALLFPLKRSRGGDRLEAFTLQLVLEGALSPFRVTGLKTLELPSIELPVSSLVWKVSVPANNHYTRLYGDIAPQKWAGAVDWYTQGLMDAGGDSFGGLVQDGSGALPVRIELPTAGKTMRYTRYWIGAEQPATVHFGHLRGWLRTPLALLGVAALAFGARRARRRPLEAVAGIAALFVVDRLGGHGYAGLAIVLMSGVFAARAAVPARLRAAWTGWSAQPAVDPPGSWRARSLPGRVALLLASAGVALLLFIAALLGLGVLMNPLAG